MTRLIDSLDTPEHLFLVLEWCDSDLFDAISSGSVVGKVTKIFSELCEGVEWLHGEGVFHRDLKPENVLLIGKFI